MVEDYTSLSLSFGALAAYTGCKLLMYKFVYIEKIPPSVDTERRNGYNISRVRPKRSAVLKVLFPYGNYRSDDSRAVIFF